MKTSRKLCFIVAILVAFTMIFSACTPTAPATSSAPPAGTPAGSAAATSATPITATYKIGLNNLFKGGYALDIIEAAAKKVCDISGMEFFSVNDERKVERVPQDVQSLISAGCKGVMVFCVVETLFPVIQQNCIDAKTPFVYYDKIPIDPAILESLKTNEYFVGGVGSQNYQAGAAIGQFAADAGLKTAIIVAAEQGDPTHEPRIQGFTDVFEKAGGKVVAVSKGGDGITAYAQKADDMLIANPEVDCIYGSGGDFAQGAILGLANHPEVKAKVFATDLDPTLLGKLKDGSLAAANGGHFVNGMFSAALLINYLDGHPIVDPKTNLAPIFDHLPLVVLPAEWADLYEKYWMQGVVPYTEDEIKSLLWRYNPDVDYQYYYDLIGNYSIEERLNALLKAGVATEAELKAANVPIK